MDAKKLGQFISIIRKENNLTQAQLATKLNVSDKTISKWETGRGVPDINMLEPLSQALNISIMELLKQQRLQEEVYTKESVSEIIQEVLQYTKRKKSSYGDWIIFLVIAFLYYICFLFAIHFFGSMLFDLLPVFGIAALIVSVWRIYNKERYIVSLTVALFLLGTVFIMMFGYILPN